MSRDEELSLQSARPNLANLQRRFVWLVLGVFCQIKFQGLGEVYCAELVALPLLLLSLTRRRLVRWELAFLSWCGAWSASQLLSDLLNHTDVSSLIKGVGAPAIFAITTIALARYLRRETIVYFLIGTVISAALQQSLLPSEYQIANPWKWGFGQDVMILGLASLSFFPRTSRIFTLLFVTIFGVICLSNNSRSMAAFPVVGYALYEMAQIQKFKQAFASFARGLPIIKLVLPIVLGIAVVNLSAFVVFSSGVTDGLLSPEDNAKFRTQATSGAGLILAGRSESLISTRAFLDSPLYGHGSWAKDKTGSYAREYVRLMYEAGVSDEVRRVDTELIPAHSFLMGALVWAGIVGGLSWLMLANGVVKRYLRSSASLPIYFHAGLVLFLWNLMFSPFGADSRWQTAVFFATLFAWTRREALTQ